MSRSDRGTLRRPCEQRNEGILGDEVREITGPRSSRAFRFIGRMSAFPLCETGSYGSVRAKEQENPPCFSRFAIANVLGTD